MGVRSRRIVAVESAIVGTILAAGTWREHAAGGVELIFISLGFLLAGPMFRRWMVLRGRAAPAPRAIFALELAAFTGLLVYPLGLWALLLAGIPAVLQALPSRNEEPRARLIEELAVLSIAFVAAAAVIRSRAQGMLPLGVFLLLALAAYRPGASRTAGDGSRRASAFALIAAAALLQGYSIDGFRAVFALAGSAAVASLASARLPIRDSYKSFAILTLNIVVLFVALNLVAWGCLSILTTIRKANERDAATVTKALAEYDPHPRFTGSDLETLTAETWRPLKFEPFTMFRERERRGRFVNVDANGFRHVKDQGPWPIDKGRLNVFVFGGSTTFGYGVADDDTVPSHLQDALAGSKKPVSVYNFGRGYYYSSQERVLFEEILASGATPDLAVFIDGLNDFYFESAPNLSGALDASTERIATEDGAAVLVDLVRQLPISRLASALKNQKPLEPDYKDGKVLDAIIDRYMKNKKLIEAAATAFGVRPTFVFQPVPTYHFPGPLHPAAAAGLGTHERSRYGYPKVAELAARGAFGDDFISCADMQQGMSGALYVDAVHYSGPMCDAIARKIADGLVARGLVPLAEK